MWLLERVCVAVCIMRCDEIQSNTKCLWKWSFHSYL